jgi:hypothetical protein
MKNFQKKLVLYLALQWVAPNSYATFEELHTSSGNASNISTQSLLVQSEENNFSIEPLSELSKKTMIDTGVWKQNCPVPLNRLRKVKFAYYDFKGAEHMTGEIVVLDIASKQVVGIFKKLHAMRFPIELARPMDEYKNNDEASMVTNNSICFNCRQMTGKTEFSLHSYGMAIDINPIQNPYLGPDSKQSDQKIVVLPALGEQYLNRTNQRPGMVEPIVAIFAQHGFKVWGGKWNTPIDWQHFQSAKPLVWLLGAMNYEDGLFFFNHYIKGAKLLENISEEDKHLTFLYKKDPKIFIKSFKDNPDLFNMETQEAYSILEKKCR